MTASINFRDVTETMTTLTMVKTILRNGFVVVGIMVTILYYLRQVKCVYIYIYICNRILSHPPYKHQTKYITLQNLFYLLDP